MSLSVTEIIALAEQGKTSEIEDILLNRRGEWNAAMREPHDTVYLRNLNLRERELKGLVITNAVIEDSDFEDADMSGGEITGSLVVRSKLDNAYMAGTPLRSTRFSQTSMAYATVMPDGATFTGSVDLFGIEYQTHPAITQKGFEEAEAYEHRVEHGDDDHGY